MPKHSQPSAPCQLRGEVVAFNIGPKGDVEGVLLATSTGAAQVNFPKHDSDSLARSMKPGTKVKLHVKLENDDEAHPVYQLCDARAEVTGTVMRLNYALHGEVNGFHLDDGTFVHLKPEGAKKHSLRVGDKVKAIGGRRVGPAAVVLDAWEVEKRRGTEAVGAEA
ncbi:MAG TPA: hypothetical protein VK841_05420 [Polyangiaceae bacterium]|nr:hypothetical protein [Polyangiaceae bacterium]